MNPREQAAQQADEAASRAARIRSAYRTRTVRESIARDAAEARRKLQEFERERDYDGAGPGAADSGGMGPAAAGA